MAPKATNERGRYVGGLPDHLPVVLGGFWPCPCPVVADEPWALPEALELMLELALELALPLELELA
ncbi:hypothetical protein [Bradyrhizobium sp. Ce-3]|uniref:hypothetical protein n=1 Tax=Bradyrhizobium sp. Ce-3 TaxID=2913970 RepID=UPI001FB9883C|nr:hypothetical protein [Bradyrhizobium sp. Ce-3]